MDSKDGFREGSFWLSLQEGHGAWQLPIQLTSVTVPAADHHIGTVVPGESTKTLTDKDVTRLRQDGGYVRDKWYGCLYKVDPNKTPTFTSLGQCAKCQTRRQPDADGACTSPNCHAVGRWVPQGQKTRMDSKDGFREESLWVSFQEGHGRWGKPSEFTSVFTVPAVDYDVCTVVQEDGVPESALYYLKSECSQQEDGTWIPNVVVSERRRLSQTRLPELPTRSPLRKRFSKATRRRAGATCPDSVRGHTPRRRLPVMQGLLDDI